jgi:hypothetical protein
VAPVVAFEHCEAGPHNCEQHFRVRLSEFPRHLDERERLIDEVCSGATTVVNGSS